MEVQCLASLALWLGAVPPEDVREHRALRDGGGHLLVRDRLTARPFFWPLQPGALIAESS